MEMAFLEAVWTECNECEGRRFKDEVLECRLRGKNIVEVLRLTIDEAVKFFKPDPKVTRRLAPLAAVGLGYLTLGQSLSTLSGGETQRTKLASELGKAGSVILCDEPTTGLAMADVDRLVGVLQSLVDHGNTVIVVRFLHAVLSCVSSLHVCSFHLRLSTTLTLCAMQIGSSTWAPAAGPKVAGSSRKAYLKR